MRLGELIDHNGKLAQWRGERRDVQKPILITHLTVSKVAASSWPDAIGKVPSSPVGYDWSGSIYIDGQRWQVGTSTWEEITVQTPIKPPRNGRTYTWIWNESGSIVNPDWAKDWYPLCRECNKQHAPNKCEYEEIAA